jgi:hypothetical protein
MAAGTRLPTFHAAAEFGVNVRGQCNASVQTLSIQPICC